MPSTGRLKGQGHLRVSLRFLQTLQHKYQSAQTCKEIIKNTHTHFNTLTQEYTLQGVTG